VKDKVLFESKEYGIGGHNKLELRQMDNGELRIWVRDGDTNALICLDRGDATSLYTQLKKGAKSAPESVECFDFTKPIHKRKVKTTSETNGVKKGRKTRSDKGKKRVYKGVGPAPLKTDGSFDDIKAQRIKEVMENG